MDVGAISLGSMPAVWTTARPVGTVETSRQFDAMIWQVLLQSGAFPMGLEDQGGEWGVMGGVLTQVLADELSRQYELGFGQAVLAQAKSQTGGEGV